MSAELVDLAENWGQLLYHFEVALVHRGMTELSHTCSELLHNFFQDGVFACLVIPGNTEYPANHRVQAVCVAHSYRDIQSFDSVHIKALVHSKNEEDVRGLNPVSHEF